MSTLYLTLKYPLEDGRVGIMKGDKGISMKCYKDSLRLKRKSYADELIKGDQLNLVNIDPKEKLSKNQLTNKENIRKMQNSVQSVHPTQIGASKILKYVDENIRVNLNIGHHPLIHDLLSTP